MKTRIYLMGYMGSGKSTLGKKLSSALDYQFIDLDRYIEETTGNSIEEIFQKSGETIFRKIESEALTTVSKKEKVVIALGGGTPCHEENIKIIKNSGISVYLQIPPKGLLHRLSNAKAERPRIKGKEGDELLVFIDKDLKDREKYYLQSDIIIDGLNFNRENFNKLVKETLDKS